MSNLLQEAVNLSNGRRMRGGILAFAYPLPDGWENGITFRGAACSEPQITGACSVADRTLVRPGDNSIFEPVYITQTADCSMLSKVGVVDMAANRLEATTEWALGNALANGTESTNPSFLDAVSIHEGAGDLPDEVVTAISCLEQAAGETGFGAEIFLHAPLRAAAYLRASHLITDDWLSPAGFQWIISPGYPSDDTTVTIWATGSVFASVSNPETLIDPSTGAAPVGWRVNTGAAISQRIGLAAFDPCLNLSVTFTVPSCTGGS